MPNIKTYVNTHLPVSNSIQYLAENQINNLTLAFQNYYDANERKAQKANSGTTNDGRLIYENMIGNKYFELSSVDVGADPSAMTEDILSF